MPAADLRPYKLFDAAAMTASNNADLLSLEQQHYETLRSIAQTKAAAPASDQRTAQLKALRSRRDALAAKIVLQDAIIAANGVIVDDGSNTSQP